MNEETGDQLNEENQLEPTIPFPQDKLKPPSAANESQVDPLDSGLTDAQGRHIPRKRFRLYCFSCNRQEGHFVPHEHRWFYSFLTGLTFGLIKLVGPYQCQCCGHSRLMYSNLFNPRYHYLQSIIKRKKNR